MRQVSREMLSCYLDDTLSTAEIAEVERALRESESLRQLLHRVLQEKDRGEHTVGAIWRRNRLSCPSRELLGSYLLQALDPDQTDYIAFHLNTICCPYCQANLADLESRHEESSQEVKKRRQRFFQSSAGLLRKERKGR